MELRAWERECELDMFPASAVAFFDQHHVVDTLGFHEAYDAGIALDHSPDDFGFYICSKGKTHCMETFNNRSDFSPFVSDTDGQIFVDYYDGWHKTMDIRFEAIERRDGHFRSIHIRGDKGHAAQLFDVPVILYDDKESNIQAVINKGKHGSTGRVVRRGRKESYGIWNGWEHLVSNDPLAWKREIMNWRAGAVPSAIGSMNA